MKAQVPYILIVANGDIEDSQWFLEIAQSATSIIAADGGSNHLFDIGIIPSAVVGDLDSINPTVLAWLNRHAVTVTQLPAAKDETDLEIALSQATRSSDLPIRVAGAAGGRLDQTLANIFLLAHPSWIDRDIELITAHQRVWIGQGTLLINGAIGDTVSLIALAGDADIENSDGLKWPLDNSILAFGPARGISNVLTKSNALVTLVSGTLACIVTSSAWQR